MADDHLMKSLDELIAEDKSKGKGFRGGKKHNDNNGPNIHSKGISKRKGYNNDDRYQQQQRDHQESRPPRSHHGRPNDRNYKKPFVKPQRSGGNSFNKDRNGGGGLSSGGVSLKVSNLHYNVAETDLTVINF